MKDDHPPRKEYGFCWRTWARLLMARVAGVVLTNLQARSSGQPRRS